MSISAGRRTSSSTPTLVKSRYVPSAATTPACSGGEDTRGQRLWQRQTLTCEAEDGDRVFPAPLKKDPAAEDR
jgi:hypothetical protein